MTEIVSGIAVGDNLIIKGFLGLRDGKVVTIVEHKAETEVAAEPDNSRSGNTTP